MTVSKDQIQSVAKLAHLNLSEDELQKYTAELDKILGYIERLNQVNTKGVEPLIHTYSNSTPTREDEVDTTEKLNQFREDFLKIAPQTEGRFFKVPKMSE